MLVVRFDTTKVLLNQRLRGNQTGRDGRLDVGHGCLDQVERPGLGLGQGRRSAAGRPSQDEECDAIGTRNSVSQDAVSFGHLIIL